MPNIFHPEDRRGDAYFRIFGMQRALAELGKVILNGGNTIARDDAFLSIDQDYATLKKLLMEGYDEHRATRLVPARSR